MNLTPRRMFFTRGAGVHRDRLHSFELALRKAGIEKYNLVTVSSICPPHCRVVSRDKGLAALSTGQICFVVLARESTNEPNRLVSAAIGLARPQDRKQYGYISEHHAFGTTEETAASIAEDLASTMLASTLGVEPAGPDREDDCPKIKSRSIAQSARGDKHGLWTTSVAAAVMLLD